MKRLKLNTLLLFILCMGNLYIVNAQSFPNTNLVTRFTKVTVDSSVAVGATAPDSAAIVDMVSATKGMFVPRMRQGQRDSITSPKNGLIIFNTNTNCLNYYNGGTTKWLSLCGTYDPAQYSFNCSSLSSGPSGTYNQNTPLNSTNTYTLSLNVTQTGNYQIALSPKTNNGYSFSASGVFTTTGIQNVVLTGAGAPVNAETDTLSVAFNGITVQPGCTLPSITINASGSVKVNCSGVNVIGQCFVGTQLSNYITVPVTSVITPGTTTITTNIANGIYFSSGAVNITASTTSITLYGNGTPTAVGTYTYSFTAPGADSACSNVSVYVQNGGAGSGSFTNPGNSCYKIDSINGFSASDGYYWIKANSTISTDTNRYRTYCDMKDGGWTLIRSLSEYQIITGEQGNLPEPINVQKTRNPVTSANISTTTFNEYAFALPISAVVALSGGAGNTTTTNLRISIKQQGHTTTAGASEAQVESTTIPPALDIWAPNNYLTVNITTAQGNPGNVANNGFGGSGNSSAYGLNGKLFGFIFTKAATSNNYTFNGTAYTGLPSGFYSSTASTSTPLGISETPKTISTSLTDSIAYISSNGSKVQLYKYYIADMFGWYWTQTQVNHHIGTCGTDDYAGPSYCGVANGNVSYWRPHNFNQRPDGNYQGRIVQYWMK